MIKKKNEANNNDSSRGSLRCWCSLTPRANRVKMKMTTDIPAAITTSDKLETRLGTLKFFDGFPDNATVQKVYDNLDERTQ